MAESLVGTLHCDELANPLDFFFFFRFFVCLFVCFSFTSQAMG